MGPGQSSLTAGAAPRRRAKMEIRRKHRLPPTAFDARPKPRGLGFFPPGDGSRREFFEPRPRGLDSIRTGATPIFHRQGAAVTWLASIVRSGDCSPPGHCF